MPYAVIDPSGNVLNIVAWDGVTPYDVTPNILVLATSTAQIGGMYLSGIFSPAVIVAMVPQAITAAQIRLALSQQNLLAAVTAAVAGASQEIQTYWQFEAKFNRQDPLLLQMATALGLTSAQVDGIFELAATFAP